MATPARYLRYAAQAVGWVLLALYLAIGLCVLIIISSLWQAELDFRPLNPLALAQIPFLVVLQVILVCGVCLAISIFGVLIPDLATVLTYILRIFFYACPIIYGLDLVQQKLQTLAERGAAWAGPVLAIYMFNPLTILIVGYRDAIFYGAVMPYKWWLVLAAETALVFIVGYIVYRHYDRRVIKFI